MMPPKKTKPESKRVVCSCQAFECYKGRFIDAYGQPQTGVEVSSATLKAHAQVEMRNKALAISSGESPTSRNINTDLGQSGNLLIRSFQNISLSSNINEDDEIIGTSDQQQANQSDTQVPEPHEKEHLSSKVCDAASKARREGVQVYDCARFHTSQFKVLNPVLLHIVLTVAVLSVFGHISMATASWLLDCLRSLLELCVSHGFDVLRSPVPIVDSTPLVLKRIPKTVTTAIKWLNIDPDLVEVNCCPSCFALYPLERTPTRCTYKIARIPGGPPEVSDTTPEKGPAEPEYQPRDEDFAEETCEAILLRRTRGKEVPVRKYAFQRLSDWIARLLSRPELENLLDKSLKESRKPFDPSVPISDIHQSKMWKEFKGPDGNQYTATSGNLSFAMFVDAINPYGNKASGKHASITFIVMVCLTLPFDIRYLPENVFLVGIAPGPREPSLEHTNWILRPIVTELQALWNPGLVLSRTHSYKNGRLVRAALLIFIADVPAIRRSLGFPSASARNFCSICNLTKSEINVLDPKLWRRRTCAQHREWAYEARDSNSVQKRKKIFQTHGVRYSVLVELEYWDIIEHHVIDPMHNLLLGLLSWHTRRFWSMQDVDSEEDKLPPITNVELKNLILEYSQPPPQDTGDNKSGSDMEDDEGVTFDATSFDSDTSTGDEEYDPLGEAGWNGSWTAPPLDEVIFDAKMLKFINSLLPRVQVPTWIKREIRVLGKASFGKLKADEWRNLFSLQLPLILVPLWFGHDPVQTSLLRNFLHLVSLVNLALKRQLTRDQIERCRHHIRQYLESSLQLFKHCHLAPNHHLSGHLPDCLEYLGPVREWWSFPFERMMGTILKGCHNNHIGELETTFSKGFSRAGNLAALLDDNKLPDTVKPYVTRLQSLYSKEEPIQKKFSNSDLKPIDNSVLDLLVKRLNDQGDEGVVWITPVAFSLLSEDDAIDFTPIQPRAAFHQRVMHAGVSYSSFTASQKDSFVVFRSGSGYDQRRYGRIFSIFTHRQSPTQSQNKLATWVHIQTFPEVSEGLKAFDPFCKVEAPDVQAHLCAWGPTEDRLVRLDEIIAHCVWLMYKPGEIHRKINIPTVALLSAER